MQIEETQEKKTRAKYYTNVTYVFTARPKAQRCQVTPYVVNVAAAAAGEGSDS